MPGKSDVFSAKNLSCVFGHGKKAVRAIDDIDFTIADQEIVSLVGGSGCGEKRFGQDHARSYRAYLRDILI